MGLHKKVEYLKPIGLVALGLIFIFSFIFTVSTLTTPSSSPKKECHNFYVSTPAPNMPDVVFIGEVELCGENFDWGNIHGPINRNRGSSTLLQ